MNNWIWVRCLIVLTYFTSNLVQCIPITRDARLTLDNVASSYSNYEHAGPGSYAFGYDIDDPESQNTQFREEERHPNGTVTGSYGWLGTDGNVYMVRYIADAKGYRANVENVPNYKIHRSPPSSNLFRSLVP